MKTKLLLLVMIICFAVQDWGQEIDDRATILVNSRKMGLVAYLTQVKYEAEFKMSALVNNPLFGICNYAPHENPLFNICNVEVAF